MQLCLHIQEHHKVYQHQSWGQQVRTTDQLEKSSPIHLSSHWWLKHVPSFAYIYIVTSIRSSVFSICKHCFMTYRLFSYISIWRYTLPRMTDIRPTRTLCSPCSFSAMGSHSLRIDSASANLPSSLCRNEGEEKVWSGIQPYLWKLRARYSRAVIHYYPAV